MQLPLELFLSESYPLGPLQIETQLHTNGDRRAYRMRSSAGSTYVVKVSEPSRPERSTRSDVLTLAYLSGCGFPAPSPVAARSGQLYLAYGNRFVHLYPYIPGLPPQAGVAFYQRLGELLARLHLQPAGPELPDSPYQPGQVLAGVRSAFLAVDDPEQREHVPGLFACLDALPSFENLPRGVIHTDPYFINLLNGEDGRLYLIDWDDSGISYPLLDVGYVIAHLCTFLPNDRRMWGVPGPQKGITWQPDWARTFLAAYQSLRPLLPEERFLLLDAVRLSFLAYVPRWGSNRLILENVQRMRMVEAGWQEIQPERNSSKSPHHAR